MTIRIRRSGPGLDRALADIAKRFGGGRVLRVGFLEGGTYPPGPPRAPDEEISIPMVAAIQNFGAGKIPPRPFFTNMVKNGRVHWGKDLIGFVSTQAPGRGIDGPLRDLGLQMIGELQESIIDTNTPALSPITIMLRKMRRENPNLIVTRATVGEAARRVATGESLAGERTKPLIDQKIMYDAVDMEIVKR